MVSSACGRVCALLLSAVLLVLLTSVSLRAQCVSCESGEDVEAPVAFATERHRLEYTRALTLWSEARRAWRSGDYDAFLPLVEDLIWGKR